MTTARISLLDRFGFAMTMLVLIGLSLWFSESQRQKTRDVLIEQGNQIIANQAKILANQNGATTKP